MVTEVVPSIPPAHGFHPVHAAIFPNPGWSDGASKEKRGVGPMAGIPRLYGHIANPHGSRSGIGKQVNEENIGIPVEGVSFPSGIPNMDGTLPGASGAQLIGKLIHDPPPNPQESPSARF